MSPIVTLSYCPTWPTCWPPTVVIGWKRDLPLALEKGLVNAQLQQPTPLRTLKQASTTTLVTKFFYRTLESAKVIQKNKPFFWGVKN